MPGSTQKYLIVDGVRRSVSAREIGLPGLSSEVFADGKLLRSESILLDQLVSPKSEIYADRRYNVVLKAQASVIDRNFLPPISVEEISDKRANHFTPLIRVILLT